MVRETRDTQNLYKGNQAISSDYSFTRYDRGHLNPSCFQCSDGRKATFTLTNAAPMNEQFNRKHWWNWEKMLRQYLIQQLATDLFLATAFIVTGTVPDPNVRIPHRGSSEDPERVTVPSHIWTAVCYKHTDDTKSFSFGYIGRNRQEDSDIRMMSIPELNRELFEHFETHHPIKIFVDDCFGVNKKLVDVQNMFQKLINLPVKQEVQMSLETQKRKISSDIIPEKKGKMNEMTGKMAFESMSNYYDVAEVLKIFVESACLITYAKPRIFVHDELRKREVSTGPDAIQCLLVSENQKTAADGSLCSSISESDYSCQCNTGGETKPCCSTPCLYMDKLNSYRCYSEKKLIVCSPPYSLITYKGQKCLDNYPCATYVTTENSKTSLLTKCTSKPQQLPHT
ncbi:hypothetical protein Q8A67_012451 [Cirrhinus molitorella]|uniref:ENPP1-3/EXOG-like endonuclease/phosphodiesterase domain-containing protein n=1 Tax=Cirrhinus molitorella TaxID=172907 RepID=A0AA88PQW1_9TELE|nr:hypothetical protein Q8A67_012451 [Cirrhinus molitorella]